MNYLISTRLSFEGQYTYNRGKEIEAAYHTLILQTQLDLYIDSDVLFTMMQMLQLRRCFIYLSGS